MEIKLLDPKVVKPFAIFGLNHGFFNVHLDTLIATWLGMAILLITAFVGKVYLNKRPMSVPAVLFESAVRFFIDLCGESIGKFEYKYFAFVSGIFFFTLACNMVALLPFIEESTKDLNTTLAIASSSFFYVQYQHIRLSGLWRYIKSFVEPVWFLLPLEIVGKLASIVSMSFRLFGNILGGSIIFILLVQAIEAYREIFMMGSVIILFLYVLAERFIDLSEHRIIDILFKVLLGGIFLLSAAQLFFGVFEAVVQAFVITMLTVTYLAIAVGEAEGEVQ